MRVCEHGMVSAEPFWMFRTTNTPTSSRLVQTHMRSLNRSSEDRECYVRHRRRFSKSRRMCWKSTRPSFQPNFSSSSSSRARTMQHHKAPRSHVIVSVGLCHENVNSLYVHFECHTFPRRLERVSRISRTTFIARRWVRPSRLPLRSLAPLRQQWQVARFLLPLRHPQWL